MLQNAVPVIGSIFGLSEIALSIARRRGQRDRAADAGSFRLLWIVIGISLTAAFVVAGRFPGWRLRDMDLARMAAVVLFVFGAALRWYSIFYLGRYFTVDVGVAEGQPVIDTGPYRLIRHPSYTGVLLEFLGLAFCVGNVGSMLLLMVLVFLVFSYRMRVEEVALEKGLGDAYASYRRRTKRLIPFVY